MARNHHFISVRPFFLHALVATSAVIIIPVGLVFSLTYFIPDLPVFLTALIGVALAISFMVIGNALWTRRPESFDIGFSERMLWRWNRRRVAEEELAHGARLLGLDRSGRPIDDVRITPEQQLQVLKDLTTALESKDPYTHGHSQRVERHSYRTAAVVGLSAEDLEDLRKAAALHDVGKIRVPDRILRKAGPLTDDERAVVEEHAIVGAWMVSSVGNADVIAAVRHHHERWDGMGYPDGLSGHDIPLFARIITVSDAFDAITSTRPYRASSGRDQAVDSLRDGAGSQFDPEIVEAFIAALPSRVPIAAGLFLVLGGPARLMRQVAMWFRRLGAGSLTPAAGATGAAIVLGASIFTPNVVDGAAPFQRVKAEVRTMDSEAGSVVADLNEDKDDEVKGKVVHKKHSKSHDAPAAARTGDGTDSSGATGTEVEAKTVHNKDPKGPRDDHTPQPPESPSPSASPDPDHTNTQDTRDGCPTDGNAGRGNDEDC